MASVIIAIVAVVALLIAIPVTYKVAIDNKMCIRDRLGTCLSA